VMSERKPSILVCADASSKGRKVVPSLK
jgi:hypothetical protein